MRAMILSAGRGERMGELTDTVPKPLLEVGGETLIGRHLERLAHAGVTEAVVNLSYRSELIRRSLGDGTRWGLRLVYSAEGEPPLETGGGIINALPLLGEEPFLLVNADVLTDLDFASLRCPPGQSLLVLVPNPPHHPGGDFGLTPSGELTAAGRLLTYSGIALLDPGLFARFNPGRQALRPILDAAIDRGELMGSRYDGLWLDVGTPERLNDARRIMG